MGVHDRLVDQGYEKWVTNRAADADIKAAEASVCAGQGKCTTAVLNQYKCDLLKSSEGLIPKFLKSS